MNYKDFEKIGEVITAGVGLILAIFEAIEHFENEDKKLSDSDSMWKHDLPKACEDDGDDS